MATTFNVNPGNVEYPENDIIPNCPVTAPNGDNTAIAGEIIASGPFYGLLQFSVSDGDITGLVVRQNMRVNKTAAAISKHDPITFIDNPTATKNDKFCRTAVATEEIHGYALEDAALNSTDVLIYGPVAPPFAVVP